MDTDPQQAPVQDSLPSVPTVNPEAPVSTEPVVERPVETQAPVAPRPTGTAFDIQVVPAAANPVQAVQPVTAPQANDPFPATAPSAFPQAAPTFPGAPQVPGVKKGPNIGLIIALLFAGLLVVGGIVAALFFLVLAGSGKVTEADLVSATTENTTYLRPQQWKVVAGTGIGGYGDMRGQNDKSTAAIFVSKGVFLQSDLTTASDEQLSAFRDMVVKIYSADKAESQLKTAGDCSEVKNVVSTKSSVKNAHAVGVFTITGICVKDGTNFKMVYYGLVGDDGYSRTIELAATESLWQQNEAVYTKMFESADQE